MSKHILITVRGHSRITAKLARKPEDPPLREVRKQIRIELETMIRGTCEADGVIRDETVIYEIGCLQKALALLPRR